MEKNINEVEEWRAVPSRPDLEVSNYGRVKSLRESTPKLLRPSDNGNGYMRLVRQGKTVYVHRLVAEAWLGLDPNSVDEINHKDGNKSNNVLSNLEVVSISENQLHAIKTGLRQTRFDLQDLKVMRFMRDAGMTFQQIGDQFDCRYTTVCNLLRGHGTKRFN
jgi:hypothetical protein